MGNLKYGISQKRLIVEWNRRKCGTQGTTVHICRALLMPDIVSLVWGHSVHFAKFPILQFFKILLLSYFSSDSSKRYTRYHNHTGWHFLWRSAKNCKKIMSLWNLLKTRLYRTTGIFNFSHNCHWSSSKLCDNIAYHSKSKCLLEYCNEKL